MVELEQDFTKDFAVNESEFFAAVETELMELWMRDPPESQEA